MQRMEKSEKMEGEDQFFCDDCNVKVDALKK